jgi:hypothetical protein
MCADQAAITGGNVARKTKASLIALFIASGTLFGVLGTAAPAAAADCSVAPVDATSAMAICWSGASNYRAKVYCYYSPFEGHIAYTHAYGPWRSVGSGQYSLAVCPILPGNVYSFRYNQSWEAL